MKLGLNSFSSVFLLIFGKSSLPNIRHFMPKIVILKNRLELTKKWSNLFSDNLCKYL